MTSIVLLLLLSLILQVSGKTSPGAVDDSATADEQPQLQHHKKATTAANASPSPISSLRVSFVNQPAHLVLNKPVNSGVVNGGMVQIRGVNYQVCEHKYVAVVLSLLLLLLPQSDYLLAAIAFMFASYKYLYFSSLSLPLSLK